jgi:hypothetical protein
MIAWITEHWKDILAIIGGVVTVASIVVRLTKSDKDDKALNMIIKILVALSLFNPDGSLIGYKEEKEEK